MKIKYRKDKVCVILANIIFFFNVFISLMIIGFSSYLIKTSFGRGALYFGFVMLLISTVFRILQRW